MWIVRIALERPYTFIVFALLILILQPGHHPAHAHGRLSEYRHPRDRGGVQLHRPERRGDGRAHHLDLRAHAHHHRGRHRAHRIEFHRRPRHHQDLLPAQRQHRRGHRAGDGGLAAGAAAASPGHHAAVHAGVQRFQRAHSAARPFRAGAFRAAAFRLRHELHPHPPGHRARLRHPVPVRRQAAADHGRPGPGRRCSRGAFRPRTWSTPSARRTSSSRPGPPRSANSNTTWI